MRLYSSFLRFRGMRRFPREVAYSRDASALPGVVCPVVAHRGRGALLAGTVLMFVCLSTFASAEGPSRSPRVRVLYTGDPISMHYVTPYTFMRVEPLVEVTPVIASSIVASYAFGLQGPDMIRRSIRLYMPRTYKSLVDSYDVIILSDSSVAVFTPKQIHWFAQSVREDGLGLVMAGGVESYQLGAWDQTEVAKILPVDCLPDSTGPGFAQIFDVEDEFLDSIPWKGLKEIGFGGSNKARTREWAKELAVLKVSAGGGNPMMVVGDVGKGRTFAFTPDWTWGGEEASAGGTTTATSATISCSTSRDERSPRTSCCFTGLGKR